MLNARRSQSLVHEEATRRHSAVRAPCNATTCWASTPRSACNRRVDSWLSLKRALGLSVQRAKAYCYACPVCGLGQGDDTPRLLLGLLQPEAASCQVCACLSASNIALEKRSA
eukprot:3407405-Pleurochrysis_carterae.AAC.3